MSLLSEQQAEPYFVFIIETAWYSNILIADIFWKQIWILWLLPSSKNVLTYTKNCGRAHTVIFIEFF